MTKKDLMEFNSKAITEEQLEELRKEDLVDDIQNMGDAPMYPALTWYLIILIDGSEINVFL